eukprot:10389486-Ditylum_brightwellii.AAC.1
MSQGKTEDPNNWNDTMADVAIMLMDVTERASDKDSDVKAPKGFNPKDWWYERQKFENFLDTRLSCDNLVPLSYIIRENMPAGWAAANRRERLIYTVPLFGPKFANKNTEVYGYLKQWVTTMDGFDWIKDHDNTRNGWAAMISLRNHYSKPGEVAKRTAQAEKTLKDLFYKNEAALPFEKYTTILTRCFFDMARGGRVKSPGEKVEIMCTKITTDNADVRATVRVIAMNPTLILDFVKATNALSEQITKLFPSTINQRGKRSYHNISGITSGAGGRGPGRRGRGGRGRGRGGRGDAADAVVVVTWSTALISPTFTAITVMLSGRSCLKHCKLKSCRAPKTTLTT